MSRAGRLLTTDGGATCCCQTQPPPTGSETIILRQVCQEIFCSGQPVSLPYYRFVIPEDHPIRLFLATVSLDRRRRTLFKYGDLCLRLVRDTDPPPETIGVLDGILDSLTLDINVILNANGTAPPGVCSCTDLVTFGIRCEDGGTRLQSFITGQSVLGRRPVTCPARFCKVERFQDQTSPSDPVNGSKCWTFPVGAPLVQLNLTQHASGPGYYGDCCECECNVEDSLAGLNNTNVGTWQPTSKCCCGQRLNQFGFPEPSENCVGCIVSLSASDAFGTVSLIQGGCGPVGGTASITYLQTYTDGRSPEVLTRDIPIACADPRATFSALFGGTFTTYSYTGSCGAMTWSGSGPTDSAMISITYTCGGGGPCANRCLPSRQWPISPNDPGGLL